MAPIFPLPPFLLKYTNIGSLIFVSCFYILIAYIIIIMWQHKIILFIMFISIFLVNSVGSNATRIELRNITNNTFFRRVFANTTSFVQFGHILMPFLSGMIAYNYGWEYALLALVGPVGIVGLFYFRVAEKKYHKQNSYTMPNMDSFADTVKNREIILPLFITIFYQISFGPITARLPFLVGADVNAGSNTVGLVISISSGALALSFLASGYLSKKINDHRIITIGLVILSIGLSLICLGYLQGNHWPTVSGFIVFQASCGFITTPCLGLVMDITEKYRAIASTLFGLSQPLSGGLSVTIFGILGFDNTVTALLCGLISISLIVIVFSVSYFRERG